MDTMKFENMPTTVIATIRDGIKNGEYTHFAIYDATNRAYIGKYKTPEVAIDVANTIYPYGCKVLYVEACDDASGSLPFYLCDIPNEYCKADTRISLFETYDKAREIWDNGISGDFDTILERCMREYEGDCLNTDQFMELLEKEYSFHHGTAIALIENIFRFVKLHYDDNESALSIAKYLMESVGIDKEDMDKLQIIK